MKHAGQDFYSGLYGFEPIEQGGPPPVALQISGDKFITDDDILVSEVRVRNPGESPSTVEVIAVPGWEGQQEYQLLSDRRIVGEAEGPFGLWAMSGTWRSRLLDFEVRQDYRFAAMSDPPVEQEIFEALKAIVADSAAPTRRPSGCGPRCP